MIAYNISFIGAGKVAGSLCRAMYSRGHKILQVVSRSDKSGRKLAGFCNASWSADPVFDNSNDLIIVSVPDGSLKEVLSKTKCAGSTAVVHTAGSMGMDLFPPEIRRKGIFYPLQTFTEGREIDFKDLPFLLESSSPELDLILENITESLGGKPYFITTDQRRLAHLSAVYACNFVNFMLTAGKDISSKAGLPFGILVPLVKETISKALEIGPERSQTGPAVRNDLITIEKHLDLLSFSPELQNIYQDVTQAILKYYKKN